MARGASLGSVDRLAHRGLTAAAAIAARWQARRTGGQQGLVLQPLDQFVRARQFGGIGEADQHHLGGLQRVARPMATSS